MSRKAKMLTVALVLVGILAATVGGIALAADPDNPQAEEWYCPGHGEGYGMGASNLQVMSELLGLTPEEIHAQHFAGKSLAEIAAEQGVSEDELVAAITAAEREFLQERVTAGILTQEQAEQRLQWREQQTHTAINRIPSDTEWRGGYGCGAFGDGARPGGMMGYRNSPNWQNQGDSASGFRMGPGGMFGRGGVYR